MIILIKIYIIKFKKNIKIIYKVWKKIRVNLVLYMMQKMIKNNNSQIKKICKSLNNFINNKVN